MTRSAHRHRARRLALQGLCCLDVQGAASADLIDRFVADSREPAEVIAAARDLMRGTSAQREQVDAILARHAHRWSLSRLAVVDRNILRLACWEMLSGETPLNVAISEALRLAREFSGTESPRFVNGVLDAVAGEIRGETERPADR